MSTDDPPPFFLITDLCRLTFKAVSDGVTYRADDTSITGLYAWSSLVAQVANVKGEIDWESLEDRADFLNRLYSFCQRKSLPFPLEIEPEKINAE